MLDKSEVRKYIRTNLRLRRELVPQYRETESHEIAKRVRLFLRERAGVWGVFRALDSEPDFLPATKEIKHIKWAFPRVVAAGLQYWIPNDENSFQKNALGVWEPIPEKSQYVHLSQLRGVFVPGRAFDRQGRRLGRGRGYYDRALKSFYGEKIGVCFSCQLLAHELPAEGHDVQMDRVISSHANSHFEWRGWANSGRELRKEF